MTDNYYLEMYTPKNMRNTLSDEDKEKIVVLISNVQTVWYSKLKDKELDHPHQMKYHLRHSTMNALLDETIDPQLYFTMTLVVSQLLYDLVDERNQPKHLRVREAMYELFAGEQIYYFDAIPKVAAKYELTPEELETEILRKNGKRFQ